MKKLIECVPNFSEGRDMNIIKQITHEIESVEGVKLLNIDPGKATNRTVVTFVGEPEAVVSAAFLAIKKAGELIDMSKHKGEHPRMGATDVCPLIPIAGVTMEETAEYAKKLAKRVGEELKFPIYLYEAAQADKKRSNLSVIRAGEYEGFFKKIKLPEWKPDFGPAEFDAIGLGRGFLFRPRLGLAGFREGKNLGHCTASRLPRITVPILSPGHSRESGNLR